jgi:hypothetical protein
MTTTLTELKMQRQYQQQVMSEDSAVEEDNDRRRQSDVDEYSDDDVPLSMNDDDDDEEEGDTSSDDSQPISLNNNNQLQHNERDDDDVDVGRGEIDHGHSLSKQSDRYKHLLFEAPEFVQRLRGYIEVEAGDSVTFTAEFRACPWPTVKWFKDEEEVRPTVRHQLDVVDDPSAGDRGMPRLVIDDVGRSDEGAYKCKVENREGVASTTGYLSVISKSRPNSREAGGSKPATDSGSRGTPSTGAISTPPLLRPIIEQKSMEEREELELSRQPPSPLQSFIDSIRHSAKSRHLPICYRLMDDNDDDVSDDDDESECRYRTSSTGDDDKSANSALDEHSRRGVEEDAKKPGVVSPCREFTETTVDSRLAATVKTDPPPSTFRQRCLLSHTKSSAHRLAIDLPDDSPLFRVSVPEPSPPQSPHVTQPPTAVTLAALLDRLVDSGLSTLDGIPAQFYTLFVAVAATLACGFDLGPFRVVLAVVVVSFLSFVAFDFFVDVRRDKPTRRLSWRCR